ncbi:glycosyltransferase family 4 protein [Granulicella sp. WH15]|uniref:glycosyltransferase family 4 protein n=1 Tax=Granulicella sp. WH15 TaxID=2602070 RepID=UPI001366BBED|nr:glycosyltransferase family 1 protein [Granulicella sp. WH15]QHN02181.1 glycosyltransferase family 4 protein [Granulicella sp. WH15]
MTPDSSQFITHEPALVVNGRYRVHRITGVQRYAHEIVSRLGSNVEISSPRSAKGAVGHLWEQTMLPWVAGDRVLWSPCGSGPLAYGRQVVTFHDLFPLEHPEWYSPAYAKWYAFAMPRLAARALRLIAVSEFTKSRLVKLLGRDPETITVVHNGSQMIDRASDTQVNEARIALKLPTRRYVLSLSSQESRKNLSGILKAWSMVQQWLPADVWLVLAGPSVDQSVYGKQQVDVPMSRVLFTGYVPEEHLAGLYSGASLFVFPSLEEGFGLPLLEAMACGVRCITSNTSSLPEVGGDVVDYVNPLDSRELAQKMLHRLTTDSTPQVLSRRCSAQRSSLGTPPHARRSMY